MALSAMDPWLLEVGPQGNDCHVLPSYSVAVDFSVFLGLLTLSTRCLGSWAWPVSTWESYLNVQDHHGRSRLFNQIKIIYFSRKLLQVMFQTVRLRTLLCTTLAQILHKWHHRSAFSHSFNLYTGLRPCSTYALFSPLPIDCLVIKSGRSLWTS